MISCDCRLAVLGFLSLCHPTQAVGVQLRIETFLVTEADVLSLDKDSYQKCRNWLKGQRVELESLQVILLNGNHLSSIQSQREEIYPSEYDPDYGRWSKSEAQIQDVKNTFPSVFETRYIGEALKAKLIDISENAVQVRIDSSYTRKCLSSSSPQPEFEINTGFWCYRFPSFATSSINSVYSLGSKPIKIAHQRHPSRDQYFLVSFASARITEDH